MRGEVHSIRYTDRSLALAKVYRFRTFERLLGPSQELARQEIYFASPQELNDPMEGLRPIVWRGDTMVDTDFSIRSHGTRPKHQSGVEVTISRQWSCLPRHRNLNHSQLLSFEVAYQVLRKAFHPLQVNDRCEFST